MTKYIIANWKMNMTVKGVSDWFSILHQTLVTQPNNPHNSNVIVLPGFIHLSLSKNSLQNLSMLNITLGAQDCSLHDKGAHTGEVGLFQISEYCQYCLIGHSEVKDTAENILKKRDLCLANGITPIICFTNIASATNLYKPGSVLALEEPGNISKDGIYRPMSKEDLLKNITTLRGQFSGAVPIVYGGSVNRDNATFLAKVAKVDGALIGNASLDPTHFLDIIAAFE